VSAVVDEPVIDIARVEREAAPAPVQRVWITRKRVGWVLLGIAAFVAGFLVFLFGLSGYITARQQRVLTTEFQNLSAEGVASTLDWQPSRGDPVAVLTIPKLGVDQVVVEGSTATMTMEAPGHLVGSPLPGRPGNSVIIGRRTSFGGIFRNVSELVAGDQIQVSTGVGAFTYVVERVVTVPAGSDDVIGLSDRNLLTIVTADPKFTVNARLAVVAKLKGLPAAPPPAAATFTTPSETGMSGDPSAIPGFLLWGELLIVAVVGTVWMWRRVGTRVAWLLGAPLVLGLCWATYLDLARLLPATL
jgi:sortase A